MSFKNKTVIITGAGLGIGFEIAKQLSQNGAFIILNDMDEKIGKKAASQLENCVFVHGDAGDLTVIKKLIDSATSNYGKLDYAIANAGITTFGPFLDYSKENLDQLLHVNIQGTFFLAQQAAKVFIEQNSGGRIVMMSSTTGLKPHDELEAYGMTKAAIAFLAKSLGTQLAPNGITVNCITPGATRTERTTSVKGYEEGWSEIIPTRRVASVEDIAATALFLLSEKAKHITGQNIIVDGGWSNLGPVPKAI
jgi:3-oxoacyl-[acyl-carrier protein] reductase